MSEWKWLIANFVVPLTSRQAYGFLVPAAVDKNDLDRSVRRRLETLWEGTCVSNEAVADVVGRNQDSFGDTRDQNVCVHLECGPKLRSLVGLFEFDWSQGFARNRRYKER